MSEITLIFAFLRHNIFATFVNTTCQMTLFILFVWLLMKMLRLKMPTTRYGFWLLAVLSPVLFLLLSILAPQMNLLSIVKVEYVAVYQSSPEKSVDVVPSVDATFAFPAEAPEAPPAEHHLSPVPIEIGRDSGNGFSLPFNFPDVAIAFWVISASLMFVRLAISYRRLLKLKADAIKLDDGVVQKIVAELGQRMGMTGDLELLASERVACPISFGMAPAKIILPKRVVNNARKSELEPMLAHELAHIKRYDYVVNLLQRILEVIFFFHPLFQLVSRNLTKEREHICDDWVIFLTKKRKGYAACLTLLLEEATFPQNVFLGMATHNSQREIVRRIEMILSKQRKIQTSIRRKAVLAILLVGCLLMPLMAGIRIVQSLEEDTKTAEQTIENRRVEHPDEDGVEEASTGETPQDAKAEPDDSIEKPMVQPPKFKLVQPLRLGFNRMNLRNGYTDPFKNEDLRRGFTDGFKDMNLRNGYTDPFKNKDLRKGFTDAFKDMNLRKGFADPFKDMNLRKGFTDPFKNKDLRKGFAGFKLNQFHEMDAAEAEKLSEELSKQAQEINKLAAELAKKQSEVAQQLEVTLAQNKGLMEKLTEMQKQLKSTLKDEMWKRQLEDSAGKMQEQLEQALKALERSDKMRSELRANQALQALKSSGGKMQKQLELALQALENFNKIRWERVKMESEIEVALRTYVGSPEDMLKRGNVAEGILGLRKSAKSLKSLRYFTIGHVKSQRAMYMTLNYVEQPGLILKLSPQVGDEWTGRAYVEGIKGHTVVESITEKVEVPAGIFENCLKLKTTITGITKEDKPSDAFLRGTRTMYFAPGVGLVKLEYQHETGHRTKIVLVDYATQNDTGYFPLDVDNTWTYRWEDGYFAEGEPFTEVWTVKEQEENAYIIHCAMRRSPEADD